MTVVRPLVLLLAVAATGCSLRTYAVNLVGDTLASGDSVYESEDDLELVAGAMPFGLKLTESLLAASPNHTGLLVTACRGYTLYSYAFVEFDAEILREQDLDRSLAVRGRAHRMYLRAVGYGLRALEQSYPGIGAALVADPDQAVARVRGPRAVRDVPALYWTAASLGLAIASKVEDAAMVARLPEVEALVDRALALDEGWSRGALHEFKVTLAARKIGGDPDQARVRRHFDRARELSHAASAGLFVAYAEAVSLPASDRAEFRAMLETALAIDPNREPRDRLTTLIAQRRARWLLDRVDVLIPDGGRSGARGAR